MIAVIGSVLVQLASATGCGGAGAFGAGAILALPILLVVALLGRPRGAR